MAPIRRYLRITKYSVLEVRIYLHKPSDAAWLLSSRDPVLPRIIQEVRPKVLPKLREENEYAKKKGGKKRKGIKDVASQDDFEVSIFLKETSTRHSLLTKQKNFQEKEHKIRSTGNKLTSWMNTSDHPISVDDDEPPVVLEEEEEEQGSVQLQNIPEADTRNKRKSVASNEDDEALFVSSSDEEFFQTQRARPSKRRKRPEPNEDAILGLQEEGEADDKKKLALDTTYDGFSIYGRILCLIVTRKGRPEKATEPAAMGGSQMMEQWVSTQAAQDNGLPDDDDG